MDRMAYIAMTGARQTEIAQAVNSNNIANASTTGFRADLHAFRSLNVDGPGYATRVNAVGESYATDFTQGATVTTGRDLDVAVSGEGFIAVQAADGSEAYTRAGDLRLNTLGQLMTSSGNLVLGEGGPVAIPPSETITIGPDGTISVQPVGQGPQTLATVDRIKLVKPAYDALEKGTDGLLRRTDAASSPPDATVRLTPGALETSNVNVAEALVTMIGLARQYEMQVKTITTAEENADAAAALLSLR
ncbi:MAG: flagellar basal-body rod protein FlgF [Pseudomonadota bacterium]